MSHSGRPIVAREEAVRRMGHFIPLNEVWPGACFITGGGIAEYFHKAYAFLCHSGIEFVRSICVRWSIRSVDLKGYLVSKAIDLVHGRVVVKRSVSVSNILAENAGWGFSSFLLDWSAIHHWAPELPIATLAAIMACKRGSTESTTLLIKVS